jgi:adenylate cyclase
MMRRRFQTTLAIALAALWGFGIYFAHDHGRLRFLDRLESTTIDLRTLMRGVKPPPDFVTIVAIDDTIVKQKGVYPLSRSDVAKIVDTIAQHQPRVVAVDLLLHRRCR